MTAALLEWETIDAEQVKAIMEGRKPNPPAGWTGPRPGHGGGNDDSATGRPVAVEPAPQV
jgi:cell division protease FtsH